MIFVFGSNLSGQHAGGAAKEAFDNFDAQWGIGVGLTGRSYALPTMDEKLSPLPLEAIAQYVADFIEFARAFPREEFFVTAIGCGIAGFMPEEIAPLFADCPSNCTLHRRFVEVTKGGGCR